MNWKLYQALEFLVDSRTMFGQHFFFFYCILTDFVELSGLMLQSYVAYDLRDNGLISVTNSLFVVCVIIFPRYHSGLICPSGGLYIILLLPQSNLIIAKMTLWLGTLARPTPTDLPHFLSHLTFLYRRLRRVFTNFF